MSATTFDIVVLVLRLTLGGMLIAHGANKVIGQGGLAGTARWFASLGLAPAGVHARLAAATELGAGALMLVGFLTPAASAAFVGLMGGGALTGHPGKGVFGFQGGSGY